ncbi:MAG: hypothetical protein A2469_02590 [Candidatus Magasanikbacteria bacterium RIFOXYC2_FULL_40_16]|uniref:Uncharacterized protein n=3 Tax=Candidatus Magasanikiibacteriota TaxID=1752731 RepID=A0A1F6NGQ0_9BACT|nr:MAG: hypothetical protein A2224_02020 [Candidatus Magasanikbacteria bacterium RIFOXYA2_FULL_40_20]OGH83012.1 MAG: hypothetical protein A2373_00440 [Candidatus Magasanikbacteria bacterium RIFOXYB1_FULL_40_15]OGH86713.1 MAG: hypothetical protein A2301_01040 [Candidatus Magasanikbacteria bacterium RIFOXYB2_FULL_40_13]OGH87350.1 MAG: hypothetical protein A2206_02760 [Candidatus Magasanikbacteria bacterium RIFOXYA1_FULL_40_8]OGH90373.1 MAG: hypothetical protein A2469_02590 [Candidatus Magasanikba
MKLEIWPVTEEEYWGAIEDLGGFIFYMSHCWFHGRIERSQGVEKDINDARQISEQLVGELFVNFGVVAPKDCPQPRREPPDGFRWYWDWYQEMKERMSANWHCSSLVSPLASRCKPNWQA